MKGGARGEERLFSVRAPTSFKPRPTGMVLALEGQSKALN